MRKNILRITLLTAALLFITAGILGGEHREVYKKASKICMECIGIG
ncbi:MAG: hypothetical protein IJR45_07605 [Firmicutes bacterium]|nr:hypothetical protein [Bacillota bacterium]